MFPQQYFGPLDGASGAIPPVADVLLGIPVGFNTGTYDAPPVSKVALGYTFGPNDSLTGTYVSIPSSNDPTKTSAYLYAQDANGNPQSGVQVTYWLAAFVGAGFILDGREMTALTDGTGLFSALMLKGGTYKLKAGNGQVVTFVVPADAGDTTPITDLLEG